MANITFYPKEKYQTSVQGYSLLPFKFDRQSDGNCLLVNEIGEYILLSREQLRRFVMHELSSTERIYEQLKAKHFLSDANSSALFDVLAAKYRTKKAFLDGFTKLHIFVPTLRCNQSCQYCQVTRQSSCATTEYDMSIEAMHKSVDLMLSNPSPSVTMEFQGGEPLLNFEVVKEGILYSKQKNASIGKHIEYVICTNLVLLKDFHIEFFKEHNIQVSTSLDGPQFLHDKNRPMNGQSSYLTVTRNIRRVQEALGYDMVNCLMTTTRRSLQYPKEIVDEYIQMNMSSMFVRDLNPYGYAVKTQAVIGYSSEEFLNFYKELLAYILELNRKGITFPEAYASLVLKKILTPWSIGFVDLQSPCGAGFGVALYNYDGNVYASDESRMLAEMGHQTFKLGNVFKNSFDEIFLGDVMQKIALASCNESLVGCSDCAYQPYCGADPVRNFATQRDLMGHRPTSGFCKKNRGMIGHIIDLLLQENPDNERIFWAWINRESVSCMELSEPTWLSN